MKQERKESVLKMQQYVFFVVICVLCRCQRSNAASVTTERASFDVSSSSSHVTSQKTEWSTVTTVPNQDGQSITVTTAHLSGVFLAIARLQKKVEEQFKKQTSGSNVTMKNIYTLAVQLQRPVLTSESTEHARQCKAQTLLTAIRKMYGEFEPWCLEMASFIQEEVVTNYLFQTMDTLDYLVAESSFQQSPVTTENTYDVLKTLASLNVQSYRARNVIEMLWKTCF
ncbi:uncharacterized protein LOC127882297 [Dreissena polymorpha]|uniref:Uncharacterized protein n=1 Tax=Dreissena polymorpha TaxID=45954 RepID=A0A9D4MS07_DREPO|nr:uncharacterized protein LOC127882297 [Dreissena polymorpha]KAH3882290.1 hypothetical protein DPMN_006224 [Dreissena polymorpha]